MSRYFKNLDYLNFEILITKRVSRIKSLIIKECQSYVSTVVTMLSSLSQREHLRFLENPWEVSSTVNFLQILYNRRNRLWLYLSYCACLCGPMACVEDWEIEWESQLVQNKDIKVVKKLRGRPGPRTTDVQHDSHQLTRGARSYYVRNFY